MTAGSRCRKGKQLASPAAAAASAAAGASCCNATCYMMLTRCRSSCITVRQSSYMFVLSVDDADRRLPLLLVICCLPYP
jgi:hypothetical protein